MALNNVPLAGQTLGNSRNQIQQNFQVIDTAFSVNHVGYNDPDQGKHKWVSFPVQAAAPVFLGGEVGLYNKLPVAPFPLTTVNELFVSKSDGTQVPMTASLQAQTGWTFLPSGILLKWGRVSTASGTQTVTFPTGATIPAFGALFSIQLTIEGDAGSLTPNRAVTLVNGSLTATNFQVWGSQRTSNDGRPAIFHYLAIGRR
jgi:hypothetical protein